MREPTRDEREVIIGFGMDPAAWLVSDHTDARLALTRRDAPVLKVEIHKKGGDQPWK